MYPTDMINITMRCFVCGFYELLRILF